MMTRPSARALILAVAAIACGGDAGEVCIVPPCLMSRAVTIAITSASGAVALPAGVFVNVTGASQQSAGCFSGTVTTCVVPGGAGTYHLEIGAPGFQTVTRTVIVTGTPPAKCGCDEADTQHLDIALVPTH